MLTLAICQMQIIWRLIVSYFSKVYFRHKWMLLLLSTAMRFAYALGFIFLFNLLLFFLKLSFKSAWHSCIKSLLQILLSLVILIWSFILLVLFNLYLLFFICLFFILVIFLLFFHLDFILVVFSL